MRPLAIALVMALGPGLVPPTHAGTAIAANPHARVRPMQAEVETLLATGMERSGTFRRLVQRIEHSDVIVYVEARRDLRQGVGAVMRFVARSATDRFLRIQLNADYSPHTLVALLGHELQHVVEVADQPAIQSSDDLRAFYRRAGVRTGPDAYDSIAARDAGYQVRAEIVRKPGDLRMAGREASEELRVLQGGSVEGSETIF